MKKRIIILALISALTLLVACGDIEDTIIMGDDSSATISKSPTPSAPDTASETPSPTEAPTPDNAAQEQSGETVTFEWEGLKLEVSNVNSQRMESVEFPDDPFMYYEYAVYEINPGAQITVISAGMTDGSLTESGEPRPNWYIYLDSGDRIAIADDMETLEITSDVSGIISGEASVFVLAFEFQG